MSDITVYRAAIGGLGLGELIVILLIVLVVFGAGKLPKIGSALGEALKNFKKASEEDKKDNDDHASS